MTIWSSHHHESSSRIPSNTKHNQCRQKEKKRLQRDIEQLWRKKERNYTINQSLKILRNMRKIALKNWAVENAMKIMSKIIDYRLRNSERGVRKKAISTNVKVTTEIFKSSRLLTITRIVVIMSSSFADATQAFSFRNRIAHCPIVTDMTLKRLMTHTLYITYLVSMIGLVQSFGLDARHWGEYIWSKGKFYLASLSLRKRKKKEGQTRVSIKSGVRWSELCFRHPFLASWSPRPDQIPYPRTRFSFPQRQGPIWPTPERQGNSHCRASSINSGLDISTKDVEICSSTEPIPDRRKVDYLTRRDDRKRPNQLQYCTEQSCWRSHDDSNSQRNDHR